MKKASEALLLVAVGGFSGFLNGFFGGGGGMLVIPALTLILHREIKHAHATAIAVILPMSAVSAAIYLFTGEFEPRIGIQVCLGVVAGGIVGAFLLNRLSGKTAALIFTATMLAAGVKLCFF